jgi:hypothetical protein
MISPPSVLTFSVIMVMVGLGIMLNSLPIVLDVMSATCAMAVMFFIPALFLLTVMKNSEFYRRWEVLACVFIVFGASLAVVSLIDVVQSLS